MSVMIPRTPFRDHCGFRWIQGCLPRAVQTERWLHVGPSPQVQLNIPRCKDDVRSANNADSCLCILHSGSLRNAACFVPGLIALQRETRPPNEYSVEEHVFVGWLYQQLDNMESWLSCFFRTCAAFYLLAVLRLCLWCVRSGVSDSGPPGHASNYAGVPLVWAFCVMAHLLPVCCAAPQSQQHTASSSQLGCSGSWSQG